MCAFPGFLFPRTRVLITEKIDESRLHTLAGNTRPEAAPENDRGPVSGDFAMDHMMLQLQRSPEQAQALDRFIDQLHDPNSPNFHRWLTANQFGQAFGAAQQDVDAISGWLRSHGFTVNLTYPSRMTIDFSGTADQVREAFRTEIHYLSVAGRTHIANMSDPRIPAALAPAVAGVVSMHDFMPRAMYKARAHYTFTASGAANQAVAPADLATIYNFNPLFSAGKTGQGQTIAVIEDSDLYNVTDWNTFRTAFGLSRFTSGSLTTVHPAPLGGGDRCAAPGLGSGDDIEATIDAEWASAAAPGASIVVASCANTQTTYGVLIALQNLLNGAAPPSIMSISYGECEAQNGAAANAAFSTAFQQAVAQGVSIFVAAGDEGGASCDGGANTATHGIAVDGFASTPYNVAVGGTDFADTYQGTSAAYWNAANSPTFGSAWTYVPEIPWNDSCAGNLMASSYNFTAAYGVHGFCNSVTALRNGLQVVAAGSGGPSGCATGTPSIAAVAGGSCQGYAKPSWQAGVAGIPNDGVRDLPDVSLFAADGVWGHFYVICWSDVMNGGAPCIGDPSGWGGAGGTSFSSPIMAGVQALVNQATGSAQGNPNYVYYQLAGKQYSSANAAACDSSSGNTPAGTCIFYDVTLGDSTVNCEGSANCFGFEAARFGDEHRGPWGGRNSTEGVLSSSSQSYSPAFGATVGWDFATGLGSVNVYNLVTNWPGSSR